MPALFVHGLGRLVVFPVAAHAHSAALAHSSAACRCLRARQLDWIVLTAAFSFLAACSLALLAATMALWSHLFCHLPCR